MAKKFIKNFFWGIILILIIFFVFISHNASAANPSCRLVSGACSADEATILKMFAMENSHAALPTDSVYNIRLCCVGVGTSCISGAAEVLALNQTSNSHVSKPGTRGYALRACMSPLPAEAGRKLECALFGIPEVPSFDDVPQGSLAYTYVESLFRDGIIVGCRVETQSEIEESRIYCADLDTTRAQIAAFLARAAKLDMSSPPTTPSFQDVPTTHWAYAAIEAVKQASIAGGCSATNFCPENAVPRDDMAVMVASAAGIVPYDKQTPTFSDVPKTHSAYAYIEALYRDGIVSGCSITPLRYCPDDNIRRDDMAVVLYRAFHITNQSACPAEYERIASVSGRVNAHVAKYDYYSMKVCCRESSPPYQPLGKVYWADMNNAEITEVDYRDKVKLILETDYAAGTKINFTIYDAVSAGGDCTASWTAEKNLQATVTDKKAVIEWQTKLCSGTTNLNFTAFLYNNSAVKNNSGKLTINTAESNTPPVAIISKPSDSQIFTLSSGTVGIEFLSASYDIDDSITLKWAITGTRNIQKTDKQFTLPFTITDVGRWKAALEVTDSRGLKDNISIIFYIDDPLTDSPPFAIISSPTEGSSFAPGTAVTFDATESFDFETAFDNLFFKWVFDGAIEKSGTGSSGALIQHTFYVSGSHRAVLTVKDSAGKESQATVNFFIQGCQLPPEAGGGFISPNTCSGFYYCNSGGRLYNTMTEGNCDGPYTDLGEASRFCCPSGHYCPAVDARCVLRELECSEYSSQSACEGVGCLWSQCSGGSCRDSTALRSCSDYQCEGDCENDAAGVGDSGLGTSICPSVDESGMYRRENCHCEWNTTACLLNYSVRNLSIGDVFMDCLVSASLSECTEGFQTLSLSATIMPLSLSSDPIAQEQCHPSEQELACGAVSIQLPFFTTLNLIIVIISISLFYFFTKRRRGS